MPAAGLAAESGAPILLVTGAGYPPPRAPRSPRFGAPADLRHRTSERDQRNVVSRARTARHREAHRRRDPRRKRVAVARFGEGGFGWDIHEAGPRARLRVGLAPARRPRSGAALGERRLSPRCCCSKARTNTAAAQRYLEDIQAAYSPQVSPVRAIYNHGWIIGNEQAISATTQAELDAALEVAPRSSAHHALALAVSDRGPRPSREADGERATRP